MMDIIYRNLLRLTGTYDDEEQQRIEPMSGWKWEKLYKLAHEHGLGPWVNEGMRRYQDDFFLQPPANTRQHLLAMGGRKDPERLERFLLEVERAQGWRHKLSRRSLKVYAADFIRTVKNIEE